MLEYPLFGIIRFVTPNCSYNPQTQIKLVTDKGGVKLTLLTLGRGVKNGQNQTNIINGQTLTTKCLLFAGCPSHARTSPGQLCWRARQEIRWVISGVVKCEQEYYKNNIFLHFQIRSTYWSTCFYYVIISRIMSLVYILNLLLYTNLKPLWFSQKQQFETLYYTQCSPVLCGHNICIFH